MTPEQTFEYWRKVFFFTSIICLLAILFATIWLSRQRKKYGIEDHGGEDGGTIAYNFPDEVPPAGPNHNWIEETPTNFRQKSETVITTIRQDLSTTYVSIKGDLFSNEGYSYDCR